MARTGLTWKLKLDDAMSGAAQKIASRLGALKGQLEGIDGAKVDGRNLTKADEVAQKIEADRASRAQKIAQQDADRLAKIDKDEMDARFAVQQRIADEEEALASNAAKARARIKEREAEHAKKYAEVLSAPPGDDKKRDEKGRFLADARKAADREMAQIQAANAKVEARIRADESRLVETRKRIVSEGEAKIASARARAMEKSSATLARAQAKENSQRERETERLRKKIEAEERKIQRAATKTKKVAQPKADDGEGFFAQLAGGFGQFVVVAQAAFDIVARVIGAIVSAVGPMITKAMELQKFAQSTKYAFGQLLGSGNAADDAWNRAQEIAIKTGLSLQEVAGSMNALMAQGMGIDEVTELTKRFADLRAINPAANIEGIARAMMQIKATGRLQGDELMQLNEAGLSSDKIYSQLEKRLGKTREEVLKLQEAGKISSKDALDAIKAALAEQTGKAAGAVAEEAASKTLGGAIGRLQAQIDKMLSSESPAFATLARAINMVVEMLAGGKFSGALSSLTGLFGSLAGLAERFVIAISKGGADDALGQMGAGLSRISKAIDGITVEDIIGGLKSLADSIRFVVELWQAFWTLGAPARDMASGVLAVVGAIGQLVIWIGRAVTELSSMIGSIEATTAKLTGGLTGAFTSSGSALGTSFVSGIVEAISNGASAMAEAARSAASSAVDAAMDAIGDIEFPSFGGTVPGGGMLGDSMMMGAAAGRDMRSGDTNRTFSPTVNVNVSGGASNTGGMVSAIGDALKSLNNSFA